MYITISGTQYPCTGYKPKPGTRARFMGVTGLSLPVEGEIQLCRNDGFIMATQSAEDYTRQTYENDVLTLTNEAEASTEVSIEEIREAKTAEMSTAAEAAIISGIDVTTSFGAEHFTLDQYDQINLSNISMVLASGAAGYLYHADGKACVMYTAGDLNAIITAAMEWVTYNTTYNNYLRVWIERETDAETITAISYGTALPEDLETEMAALLAGLSGGA